MVIKLLCKTSLLCTAGRAVSSHSSRSLLTLRTPELPFRAQGKLKKGSIGIYLTTRCSSMSSSASLPEKQAEQVDRILAGRNDDHGGVIVEMTNEPLDSSLFVTLLRASISQWRQQGKRGVWIKLPIELVNLVEPAVKEGFYYHHAEPNYLMLVHWLPTTASTIPANATHRVGVGAFVMNEKNEVLVVQERSGQFRGSGVWKFPTGVVDEGEDICNAAVREVKEETGIDAKFVEILAFRQSHKSFFEKSDLFFVCMLQPLSFNIRIQEKEIEAAQWIPYEKYASQPFIQKHELFRYIANICSAKIHGKYSGFSAVSTVTSFSQKESYLYLNKKHFP
ncbi:nudix hydrolase 2-like isoform X2 [Ipomoea triloba]|uniref:nudix hydrolase 2-like isoform X1 n=1 Tax=Ipomoea triloba TaxID=35885 RepID=UPI00125D5395|nr:nudix hydrolase 2-like isoform X1 [Ipomoea triloba]XP_031115327.1 nudix hydrolase 2-like isoform X2 [Ipomoea triloba]